MTNIGKNFFCFSMALDEKRGMLYTGGNKSRAMDFPGQTNIREIKRVKNCSPYLSPSGTYVMFFNDSSSMSLYAADQLETRIYHGRFKPSGSNLACWKDDTCFLFATEGTVNRVCIDAETKTVRPQVWMDLRKYMGNPDLQITSVDCYDHRTLLFIRKWIPGERNCIAEIDDDGNVLIRTLGEALSGYDDVRYDRRGGAFYSNRSKDMAWCETIDCVARADKTIEGVKAYCTRISSDGRYVVSGTRDGEESGAVIVETDTFSIRKKFEYRTARWGMVGFSSDGRYALIGGKPARIIDVKALEAMG